MKYTLFTLLLTTSIAFTQNAVIFNDATFYGGHADGQLLIADDVFGTNYEVNQHNTSSFALYVGGDNNTTNFLRANHGSSMIVGNVGTYQGSQITVPTPNFAYYAGISNTLASYVENSHFTNAQNNVNLNLKNDINVFNINSSSLTGYRTLDFIGDGIVIFNVTGNVNEWGWSVNYDPNKIVWNFIDAEIVNINNRQFTGSLIAPNANVTQSQNINGTLIADNWTVYNSAELHNYTIPACVIPEPSAAILGSFGALLLLRRRR